MSDRIAFSPDEAAHRAGVGRTLIFAEIRSGRLEAHKAGARTLITADALTTWIKSLPRRGSVASSGAPPPPPPDPSTEKPGGTISLAGSTCAPGFAESLHHAHR